MQRYSSTQIESTESGRISSTPNSAFYRLILVLNEYVKNFLI